MHQDSLILVYHLSKYRRLSLFVKTYAGCFVALMASVAESLIQLDTPPIISGVLSVSLVFIMSIASSRSIASQGHLGMKHCDLWFILMSKSNRCEA